MKSTRVFPLRLCILATLTLFLLAGCGGARARYESHLERGKQYLGQNNLDKAGIEFRNALQIVPKDANALYYNGRIAEGRQQVRQAIGLYQAAVDADPNLDDARARLARAYIFAGAAQRALEVIGPGIARHPDDPDLLAARAAARQRLNDNKNAKVDAEHAVRVAPDNENAVSVLAALYLTAGDSAQALTLVSAAVGRLPTSVELRRILAQLYLNTAQRPLAEEQMREIARLRPRDLTARLHLATELSENHQVDAAQRVLEDAVRDFSADTDATRRDSAKLALAGFLASQRSSADGEKKLRAFIAAEPKNSQLQFGLAEMLESSGNWQGAFAIYEDVAKREGTGPQGLVARARQAGLQLAHGHSDEALRLVGEVLKSNPRDADALFIRANIQLQKGDASSAIADLRAVVRDQPHAVRAQQALARAFAQANQPALAEEAWRAALQAAPNDPAVLNEFVQFSLQANHGAQALPLVEQFVARVPDNAAGREMLTRIYLAQQDLPKAVAAAQELQTRFPHSPAGFYLTGMAAAQEKHWDDSRTALEHGLALAPASVELWLTLARVDAARGRSADTVTQLRAATERPPTDAGLLNLLGELYVAQHDRERAGDAFTRASKANPASWLPHRNLAQLELASADLPGATTEYETALRLAPTEPRVVMELAALYEKQGRVNDAIARYDSLYRASPAARQIAANNLAMLLVTYRNDGASLDRARQLTSDFATSDNGLLLDTSGWVRFKRREYQDAAAILERAARRSPDSRVIRYHLGMAELQLGQRDRARSDLEAALAGSGTFAGADEARTVLSSLDKRSG